MSTVVAVARTPRPSAVRAASFVAEPVPPLAIGSGALPLKNVFNVLAKLPRISAITLRMALSTLPAGQPVLMLMPFTVVLLDALDHQSKISAIYFPGIKNRSDTIRIGNIVF